MKQKIVRRASALVLAGCLLAGAALPALAASAKEEVIYANLDASGTVTGVYAVNSFAVQAGDTVTDHGSYTAVRNMTTTDPLEHSGDTVTATMAQDGKLYYEGTMDTATALPWLVKLTYTLDGAEIAPEELGGKSGALAIRLQVSRNPDCTGDFFDQYALQVTMTLDTDRAQNIVADGATMANVGSNKQLSYILLPGSDSDVTVTADVTDFAMNAISLNGVKLRLNLGLDGADLTGMLDRLQSGSVQLDDGANALADGIAQVQAGLDTLNGKSGALTGGSAKVKAALTQMQTALNGVSASTDQLTTLLDASTQIQNGIAQLDAGAAHGKGANLHPRSHTEPAGALGAHQAFVAGEAHHADVLPFHVNGKYPCGLGGIQNEQKPVLLAEVPHPLDVHQIPRQVGAVGAHHCLCIRPQEPLKVLIVDPPLPVCRDEVHRPSLRPQSVQRTQNRVMLQICGDHMVPRPQQAGDGDVQRHGGIGREGHTVRPGTAEESRQRLTDRRFQRFDIIERMLAVAVVRGIAVEPLGPPGIGHHRRSEFRPVGGIDDEAPHGIAPEIDAQKIVGSRLHSYFD